MARINNKNHLKKRRQALRNRLTAAEAMLWLELKQSKVAGAKFRRQHSLFNYIVDFYCPEVKLAVELDGSFHNRPGGKEYDRFRDQQLQKVHVTVMRIPNQAVFDDAKTVALSIGNAVESLRTAEIGCVIHDSPSGACPEHSEGGKGESSTEAPGKQTTATPPLLKKEGRRA